MAPSPFYLNERSLPHTMRHDLLSLMLDMPIFVNNSSHHEANLLYTCCPLVNETILNQLIFDGSKLWQPCLPMAALLSMLKEHALPRSVFSLIKSINMMIPSSNAASSKQLGWQLRYSETSFDSFGCEHTPGNQFACR
jgi:hypothetical protein